MKLINQNFHESNLLGVAFAEKFSRFLKLAFKFVVPGDGPQDVELARFDY